MCVSKADVHFFFNFVTVLAFLLLSSGQLEAAQTFAPVPGLAFSKPFAGADPLPQTVTIGSTGTNFDFSNTVTTTSGGNWLSVSVVGFNCCATPRAVTVVITTAAAMAVGPYTGQIVFKSSSGTISMAVPVTLTVEPANGTFFGNLPGQVSFSLLTGGTTITSQSIQIRNGGSGTLNWNLAKSTSDGGNWLTVSASSGTAPSPVTLGVTVANLPGGGLIAGNFIGQLVFSQASGGNVTIPVSVVVGSNILSQVNGISFTKPFGGAEPLPQTLSIPSTGTNFDFDYNAYTATGGNWLSVSAVGFNCCATPRALTAVVTTSPALAVGTYTGQIVVTIEGSGSMAITVPVTLTVEPANGTFFGNLTGQVSFSLQTGGVTITTQDVPIQNGGSGTLNWNLTRSTSDAGNWLTVSASSGTAPSLVTVGVSIANLPGGGLIAGNFIGELVFSQSSGGSVTIPVSVVVGNNILSQVNGIYFTKVFGGADPLPQTLSIPSTGTNFDFDYNAYTATGGNWLSVTVVGFNCCATPRALTAVVTTSPTLAVGTYTGQIVVTIEGNGSMAITVPVTLTVEPANGTFLDDMQGQMSFSLLTGSGSPAMQNVQIRSRGAAALAWTLAASTSDGGNWLTVSATSGTAPATVNVGVVASALPGQGLVAGNFIGNLVIRSANSTTTIPVSVVVGANVFVQLPTITFTKTFGGANPASQNVTIASTGTNFDFDNTWATATGGAWLSVTVAGFNCCATPRAITANITASPTLAAGTYTGQIVVTAEGNGSMAMTIPVILTVQPTVTQPPAPVTVSLATGQGASQTFTFTFSDGAGWQDLAVVDVLINNFLDGRQACYVAFAPASASSGALYLVDDAGDGGYASGSPLSLPSSGTLHNSQCTIGGAGSLVSASGNTLMLTLPVTFTPGFAGNKIFYMAARSNSQNSGWQALGTWGVPGPAPVGPAVGGVTPGRSSTAGQTYTFIFTDTNGYGDLAVVDVLTNNFLNGIGACYVAFAPTSATSGQLYLVDDAGDGGYASGSPISLPSTSNLQNHQCTINGAGSSVSASGNTLTLNLPITFSPSFAGNQVFYLAARNNSTGNSGWQSVGSVTVP